MNMRKVVIIGAGTMGAGIAEVCARAGFDTALCDVEDAVLERARARIQASMVKAVAKGKMAETDAQAAQSRIRFETDTAAVERADLVIEAVPERIDLKKQILHEVSCRTPDALIASNTSSLSVTEIAAACRHPARVIGLHFFNPVPVMSLLEIVRAEQNEDAAVDAALAFAARLDKSPIVVRDMPGFATSRLGIALGMEAIRMLEQGVASAEDIDRAMELGYRHPMGPLRLTDLVGLDVRLAIAEHLTRELGPQFAPPPLLRQKVRAGKLGKKTGEGFYKWP
ncbi:MAG: 3-hydroxyacyl-CoA dehydrogenase family protein [Myxococcota bacterium]